MAKNKGPDTPVGWAEAPEAVGSGARDLWPDISKWPTPKMISELIVAKRRRPDDYQAVVNGLRWCTTADMMPAWSYLTAWLAVVAILFAAISSSFGTWALWGAIVFGAAFTVMLIKIGTIVDYHIDRTRHAAVWLAALEEAQTRRSARGATWPWSR